MQQNESRATRQLPTELRASPHEVPEGCEQADGPDKYVEVDRNQPLESRPVQNLRKPEPADQREQRRPPPAPSKPQTWDTS